VEIDLAKELGAEEEPSTQRLTLYLPDKDQTGHELLELPRRVDQARELLSRIGGGATAFPPADGTWANERGELLWEQTRIVFCYIRPDQFCASVQGLRDFLHHFGRETNQGEVVVEFDGRFYRIRQYDVPIGG
jgi:hypothetical protein